MLTYKRLPGRATQETLSGISDWFGMPSWVRSYWETVKKKVKDIQDTGYKISLYQQKISIAHYNLVQRGMIREAKVLEDELKKIEDDLQKWWRVKGYIDKYWPEWAKLDTNEGIAQPGSAVGAVPFVLAGMGLTALAYVVNTGMALVQDYMYKSQLTQAVINNKIEAGEMRDILSVPKDEGVIEKTIGKVGTGMAVGLPILLVVGGGAYLLMLTGGWSKLFGEKK